jgi:hypothetical protein
MMYVGIRVLMIHKSIGSTEVYTKVFALDVTATLKVQFEMVGIDENVNLLKKPSHTKQNYQLNQ